MDQNPDPEHSFFFCLTWNLVSRGNTSNDTIGQNYDLNNNFIVLNVEKSKANQSGGISKSKRLYSNPLEPDVCIHNHLFCLVAKLSDTTFGDPHNLYSSADIHKPDVCIHNHLFCLVAKLSETTFGDPHDFYTAKNVDNFFSPKNSYL